MVDGTPIGDYIDIDGTSYYLNTSVDETYSNMVSPCYYIMENVTSDTQESLYLRWDGNLDYKVKVKSRDNQYNAPVTLGIKIGTLSIGEEKYTMLFWYDASQVTYYFDGYNPSGAVWTGNPGYMVDGNIGTYASTSLGGDVELCNNNSCSGFDFGIISKVELRVRGYYSSSQRDIILTPVFNGTTDGGNYTFVASSSPGWSSWFDTTNDSGLKSWSWSMVSSLDCKVKAENVFGYWFLYCSKVELRVTYNPYLSEISNPYPMNGSVGVSIDPLLNITVVDSLGFNMNITWYSNSSGSWQVFGTNNSVFSGAYHQSFVNASVNGMWYYWKVNVTNSIGGCNESDVFRFYTGYESMVENTGSTIISGFLLIQVQYYNTTLESWVVANDTINETNMRTINSSEMLGLDTFFNGNVNSSYLLSLFGNGTYRVYAAFRDPDGNVLVCDDDSLMEVSYEFTINYN